MRAALSAKLAVQVRLPGQFSVSGNNHIDTAAIGQLTHTLGDVFLAVVDDMGAAVAVSPSKKAGQEFSKTGFPARASW